MGSVIRRIGFPGKLSGHQVTRSMSTGTTARCSSQRRAVACLSRTAVVLVRRRYVTISTIRSLVVSEQLRNALRNFSFLRGAPTLRPILRPPLAPPLRSLLPQLMAGSGPGDDTLVTIRSAFVTSQNRDLARALCACLTRKNELLLTFRRWFDMRQKVDKLSFLTRCCSSPTDKCNYFPDGHRKKL